MFAENGVNLIEVSVHYSFDLFQCGSKILIMDIHDRVGVRVCLFV